MNQKQRKERKVFQPCSIKQQLVLKENEADLLLTGGGAGSGKSFLSLLKAASFTKDGAAKIMILRLSYPMLKDLISASHQIYPHFGGTFKIQSKEWHFPSGCVIDFKAMPKNLLEVQGWERTFYIIDEAAEWEQDQVLAVMSRLRSTTFRGHKSIMLSCNPSKTSWLYDVTQYSHDDNGIPIKGTEYRMRYFVVQNSKFKWADSEEELYQKYGQGMTKGTEFVPLKFKFVPMTCYDNPVLLREDPGYVGRLLSQPRVNQLRLLHGSWLAQVEGSSMVTEDLFDIVPYPPKEIVSRFRAWDLAASVPNEANAFKADWSVGVLMSKDIFGNYYVEDVVRFQEQIDGVLKRIRDTAIGDGLDIIQILPVDPGQAGKVASRFYTNWLAEHGVSTRVEQTSGNSGKVTRFGPFASVANNKCVKLVRGEWNRDYLDELCFFTGERKGHDDQVDATSSCFNTLAKNLHIPDFSIPIITQASPIPRI